MAGDSKLPIIEVEGLTNAHAGVEIAKLLNDKDAPFCAKWNGITIDVQPGMARGDIIASLRNAQENALEPIPQETLARLHELAGKLLPDSQEEFQSDEVRSGYILSGLLPLVRHSVRHYGIRQVHEKMPHILVKTLQEMSEKYQKGELGGATSRLETVCLRAGDSLYRGLVESDEVRIKVAVETLQDIRDELSSLKAKALYDAKRIGGIERAARRFEKRIRDHVETGSEKHLRRIVEETMLMEKLEKDIESRGEENLPVTARILERLKKEIAAGQIDQSAEEVIFHGAETEESTTIIDPPPSTKIEPIDNRADLEELQTLLVRKALRDAGEPTTAEVVNKVRADLVARQKEEDERPKGISGLLENLKPSAENGTSEKRER